MTSRAKPSLEDVHARLEWADGHLAHLQSSLKEWLQSDGFEVTRALEADGWYRLRFARIPEPPGELVRELVNMLSSLRSALDYLAWQLVVVSGGTPGTHTAFPIVRRAGAWPDAARRRLAGMDAEYVNRIRELQPFHDDRPEQHPLTFLDDANNRTKHRFLAQAAVNRVQLAVAIGFERPHPDGVTLARPRDPEIREGAVIFAVRPDPPDTRITLEIPQLKAGISFDTDVKEPRDFPDLTAAVSAVVDRFADAFAR